ncbi:hypothetical protein PT974_00102 [Cladobotryum mycophilum]|uniref:Heterokaryon incompatibility domain-containing protein n=1 Tax=Cladobotryum mycophilum TaxID=491253 RepID=A0ABR0T162_9HYPO
MPLCSQCARVSLRNVTQELPVLIPGRFNGLKKGMVLTENGSTLSISALNCSFCTSLIKQHDIIGRPRLLKPDCDDAFSLLKRWINACQEWHVDCKRTVSGNIMDDSDAPELPSRILHIKGERVKLVESKGQRGRYATLSHCWGPSDKQPLKTTRANLPAHIEGIPWSNIPKTFQDAITVADRVGFQYIWIDSLCIVQDDREEWLKESKKMGLTYERAELTIAASHTADSWEGFLFPRDPSPTSVELPRFFSESKNTRYPRVFAALRRDTVSDTLPEFGALGRRAWATQEWLLSRRMVFFAKSTIIWSCKTITQRETGEKCFSIARNSRWKPIVECYSDRQLTFATDKLIALEGLRTESGRNSGYEYLFGVWRESLPDQLLWQVTRPVDGDSDEINDPLKLPTWTWAHVPCGVRFLHLAGAKNLCESVGRSDGLEKLVLRMRVRRITATTTALHTEGDGATVQAIRVDISASHAKRTSSMAQFILNERNSVVGWAVFDQRACDVGLGKVCCLALMGGVGRRDEDTERRLGTVVSSKLRHYWVLIVRKREDGSYIRIGVGKTYGREWWVDAPVKTLTLS